MKTLLLIEDQTSLRDNLRDILALDGYHVLTAGDGGDGLHQARQHKPDLIICDIMLPGMDGYEVLARLRGDGETASLPFIFLTAKGSAPDIRAGMNLGADDYLPKPVGRLDLLKAVRTRLQRHAQQCAFAPNFDDPRPLEKLGISEREAEVLLWIAQGKGNPEIAEILGLSVATVKKHTIHIFEKLGVEGRSGAMLTALERLAGY